MIIKLFEKFNEPIKLEKFWDNGQKSTESWMLNGEYHREDRPAFEVWYENGQKWYEYWYLNGKRHREDGPAEQWWDENGKKQSESWYLNNKYYSREKWVEDLKNIGSPHYEEQLLLYNMEKYNL